MALGMIPMLETAELREQVKAICRRLGLPLEVQYNRQLALEAMRHDKKAQSGHDSYCKGAQSGTISVG